MTLTLSCSRCSLRINGDIVHGNDDDIDNDDDDDDDVSVSSCSVSESLMTLIIVTHQTTPRTKMATAAPLYNFLYFDDGHSVTCVHSANVTLFEPV